jgi:gliding motility-associated-like protein
MSIKGSILNPLQLGSAFLTATQPGNGNYAPASNVNELVTIQDQNGDKILVHQAVSPNGDGVNDFLLIEGIENYPINRVAIINLNGETIYEVKGYDNSTKVFDGHSNINGHVEQPGTYFYMVEYTVNGQTRRKTGYFILKIN